MPDTTFTLVAFQSLGDMLTARCRSLRLAAVPVLVLVLTVKLVVDLHRQGPKRRGILGES